MVCFQNFTGYLSIILSILNLTPYPLRHFPLSQSSSHVSPIDIAAIVGALDSWFNLQFCAICFMYYYHIYRCSVCFYFTVRDRERTKMERDILADVNHPYIVKLHYGML